MLRGAQALGHAVAWHRRSLAAVAAAVAVLAAIGAISPPDVPRTAVVRAARDVQGGASLRSEDLDVVQVLPDDVPEGAATDPRALVGQTVVARIPARQILTESALVRAGTLVSVGRALTPVRLSDAGVAALLRTGDQVDVISSGGDSEPVVLARGARVAGVPAESSGAGSEGGGLVLFDVAPPTALRLAAAATGATLSVVMVGHAPDTVATPRDEPTNRKGNDEGVQRLPDARQSR